MEETADSVKSQDGEDICTICGFSAKCPRSLKIHYARKHGKNTKNINKNTKLSEDDNISDDLVIESATELKQKEQCDSEQLSPSLDKMLVDEDDVTRTQERRLSKRTPKPKIIHSCNYCGQEFRDKSPLDIHIQRYHTKDVPYTCEYGLYVHLVNAKSK